MILFDYIMKIVLRHQFPLYSLAYRPCLSSVLCSFVDSALRQSSLLMSLLWFHESTKKHKKDFNLETPKFNYLLRSLFMLAHLCE
jgi:hypothetical protein